MPDIMEEGAAMLRDELPANLSQTVKYWRRSKSVSVSATLGETPFEVLDQNTGIATQWRSQDFLIKPGVLIIDGVTITPAIDDEIEWSGKRFKVLPPAGERHSRESGAYGYLLRIHTKLVEL